MEELKLKATKRDVLGKKNRFLRRQGVTPTHLFGHNVSSLALQCDTLDLKQVLERAGTTRLVSLSVTGEKGAKTVFVKEIQQDPFTKQLIHVDFYQIKKGQKMTMNVPIVLVGESPALKGKGRLLTHGTTELTIACLPEKVPPQIDVDISVLEDVDDAIFVKDLTVGAGIDVNNDPDQLVVKISEVSLRAAAAAEALEGEEAEVEGGAEAEAGEAGAGAAADQEASE